MSLAIGTGTVLIAENVAGRLNSLKNQPPLQHHTCPFHSRSTLHSMVKGDKFSHSAAWALRLGQYELEGCGFG